MTQSDFVIKTLRSPSVDRFVFNTNEKLSNPTNKTILFKGKVRSINIDETNYIIFKIKTLIPPFYHIFWVLGFGMSLVFGSVYPLLYSSIPFLFFVFVDSPLILLPIVFIGLKKQGYKGKIRII